MILVVSAETDDHARAVRAELDGRGADLRLLDLSSFPRELGVSLDYDGHGDTGGRLTGDGVGELRLADCEVVWWRRPQPFELDPAVADPVDYNFAYTECQATIDGLWLTLDAFWVNHPTRNEVAGRKAHQLAVASEVGFDIPETRITNSPAEARAFVERHGPRGTVYKPFSGTEQAWRETRVLDPGEVALLDSVAYAPVIFQEYVPAEVDLRVTVMGEDVFPAAIHAGETEYPYDYRMAMDEATMKPAELPHGELEQIHDLMDRLGLVYGAIDMRRTHDGRHVFLEVNPAGQWLFIERRTGLPLTATFANLLASHAG